MGNIHSLRTGNFVRIQAEKQAYHDGEVVEGVVCLNLVDPLDISSIECQIQGIERTDFLSGGALTNFEREFERKTSGTKRTDLGRLDQFLSVCCTLPDTNQRLEPGQYQWDFKLGLPEGTRGTFRVEEIRKGSRSIEIKCGKVEYRLHVYVGKRDKRGKEVAVCTHSQPLVVHRRAEASAAANEGVESSTEKTVTQCCVSQGTIRVRAVVDRNAYRPGDKVAVRVEVDNQSKQHITAVQLALHHMNWLRVTTQLQDYERRHIEHFYRVPPDDNLVKPFSKQERVVGLQLPEGLPCTYTGTCITSKFFITVNLRAAGVGLKIPITILPPQLDAQGLPAPLPERPDWWQPHLMGAPVAIKVRGAAAAGLSGEMSEAVSEALAEFAANALSELL